MGFFERNRKELAEKGIDPSRLPPGQYLTERFPVLHVGDVPTYAPGEWSLSIFGMVDQPFTLTLDELKALPSVTPTFDIHCVTMWSKFDTTWTGVRVRDLLDRAKPLEEARFVMLHSSTGYTTNLPLGDFAAPDAILATHWQGQPLTPAHGGPLRAVVPHLYFWKSAKWLRRLEIVTEDQPGFWETLGYHNYGDPWKEQRYQGD